MPLLYPNGYTKKAHEKSKQFSLVLLFEIVVPAKTQHKYLDQTVFFNLGDCKEYLLSWDFIHQNLKDELLVLGKGKELKNAELCRTNFSLETIRTDGLIIFLCLIPNHFKLYN